ncbi:MAG: TerD family protein, partial [Selenomonadaceae bacterium]|nr:TerD family protein [Selenomonadaceae bacterium]
MIMIVQRGSRDKLEKFFDLNRPLKIILKTDGAATYDFCCFCVDANNKLSDDRYMIFYNQLSSPNGEIIGKEVSSGMDFT